MDRLKLGSGIGLGLGWGLAAILGGCWGSGAAPGQDEQEAACSVWTSEPEGCDVAVWTRVLGTLGPRTSIEALVADDARSYAAVRSCEHDGSSCSTTLVALDAQGEELWTQAADWVSALAIAPDGGVYGARPLDFGGDGAVTRWSADGTALWTVPLASGSVSIDADAEGVYVGGTSSTHTDADGGLGTIVPVQADGTPLPEIVLDVHGVSRLRRTGDGFVLVNWGSAIVRVDEAGARKWLTIVDEHQGLVRAYVDDIALADDAVLAIGNPDPADGQETSDVEVFRLALEDGAVLDRYPVGARTRATFSPDLVSRFGVFADGSAVHVTWGVDRIDVYWPDATLAWQQAYASPATATPVALAPASDGFVVAGTGSEEGPGWWIKRFPGP